MDRLLKTPFYVKASLLLIGLFAFLSMLFIARSIIVPIVFALIIAIVLHPVVSFFVRIKINRVIAVIITLLLTTVIMAVLGILIISQVSRFSESWPQLVEKFTALINQAISAASGYLEINTQQIHSWIAKTQADLLNTSSAAIGRTLAIVGNGLVIVFLIPVYIFLMLYYQPLLIGFIRKLFGPHNETKVNKVVTQTKTVTQQYLVGLLIEAIIIAILEIAALLFLGIDYAILLGILGTLLNIIPYIGGIIAVAMPMAVALVTKDNSWCAVYVLIIYYIIQLIDNNFIVPKIVSSKVKINALFSIIAVIAGNALWGISGMFLSIPLLAILKVIFDNIESLKPWGGLLGDTMPPRIGIKPLLQKISFVTIKKEANLRT
jgi:predicted PurR-regulated permease PerM